MGWDEADAVGLGKAMSYALFLLPFPSFSRAQRGHRRWERPEWYFVSSFWAVPPPPAQAGENWLESLFLRQGGNEKLLVPEVPPGCHVECHVG